MFSAKDVAKWSLCLLITNKIVGLNHATAKMGNYFRQAKWILPLVKNASVQDLRLFKLIDKVIKLSFGNSITLCFHSHILKSMLMYKSLIKLIRSDFRAGTRKIITNVPSYEKCKFEILQIGLINR